MNLLLHGVAIVNRYLVDVGELVAVPAVNARDAYLTARILDTSLHAMAPRVYQLDPQGELIAVYE